MTNTTKENVAIFVLENNQGYSEHQAKCVEKKQPRAICEKVYAWQLMFTKAVENVLEHSQSHKKMVQNMFVNDQTTKNLTIRAFVNNYDNQECLTSRKTQRTCHNTIACELIKHPRRSSNKFYVWQQTCAQATATNK